jgi:hypothetical protein
LRVRIEKLQPHEIGETYPSFATLTPPAGVSPRLDLLAYGAEFRRSD